MILLGVNIDHVATVRQARGTSYPDIVEAALAAERGGADGITVHLREDRRHIQDRDVERLLPTVRTKVNLEMAVTPEMVGIALPAAAGGRLPGARAAPGGDHRGRARRRRRAAPRSATRCAACSAAGMPVSLFIDRRTARRSRRRSSSGAEAIEIHTGRYADAVDAPAAPPSSSACAPARRARPRRSDWSSTPATG